MPQFLKIFGALPALAITIFSNNIVDSAQTKINNLTQINAGVSMLLANPISGQNQQIDVDVDTNILTQFGTDLKLPKAEWYINQTLNTFKVTGSVIIDQAAFNKGVAKIIYENYNTFNDWGKSTGLVINATISTDKTVDWFGCGGQGEDY